MNRLYIIKVGTTFPRIKKQWGDFDVWTTNTLGTVRVEKRTVNVLAGDTLPAAEKCAGVVITGSHAMVTDNHPWSLKVEKWIVSLVKAHIPFFGICYGHQLLAKAIGGKVGYHPNGIEIGTVAVDLLPDCVNDPLFQSLPQTFLVHAAHSQTVLRLPPGAIRLAGSVYEPNHAFRLGDCTWGVQFHPEYDADIMRSYIRAHATEHDLRNQDISNRLLAVQETPFAAQALNSFAQFVEKRVEKNNRTYGGYQYENKQSGC